MRLELDSSRAASLIDAFAAKRVLVIGDLMLDEFLWGKVSRISPEAPVPVVNVTGESYYPGGAANVARNLREFTTHVAVMGVTGADPAGCRLLGLLQEAGIDTAAVQQDSCFATTVKTRIIARNQQVVRVDRERAVRLDAERTAHAVEALRRSIGSIDAIVVADYGKGFLSQDLADRICETSVTHGPVLAVDPHPYTSLRWRGATAVKPNRAEAFQVAGLPPSDPVYPPDSDQPLLEAGRRLLAEWQCRSLLVTLGEHGMLLFEPGAAPRHTPTHAHEVFDVSGAGDTAIAVLAMALAAGAAPAEAAEIANRASGIVVGKLGTATVTPAELLSSWAR